MDGEYLVKLDADDLLAPGSLARATALLEAHPEVGFVTGRPMHFTTEPAHRPTRTPPVSWTVEDGPQLAGQLLSHRLPTRSAARRW